MQSVQGKDVPRSKSSNLGFGLERIGIITLRHPRIASIILLLSLLISAIAIPNVGFDGNIVNVINQNSKAYKDFEYQNQNFRSFAGDIWFIIKSPRLATAKGLEELRSLHLDLALEDNVGGVFSIFSLGNISAGAGGFKPLIPDVVENDEQAKAILARIIGEQPAASAIVAPDKNALMMVVSLDVKGSLSEQGFSDFLSSLKSTAKELSPPDFEIVMSGYPAIRAAIVDALISDQTMLTLAGIAIGAIVSLIVFGNIASAIVCTFPPAIAVAWILAMFSMSGIHLNFLTTVLPTLALIISFADGIVVYFRWQALNKASKPDIANLEEAIRQVGPASSLTSITTALAFLSFAWADSATMNEFALFGMGAVMLAFLAVMVGLPLACYWSDRLIKANSSARGPAFRSFGVFVAKFVLVAPIRLITISLVLLIGFGWIHLQLSPAYTTISHLPYNSEIRAAEEYSDEAFGGTSQYLIIVPVSRDGEFSDVENRERIQQVNDIAVELFGPNKTLSLDRIWKEAGPQNIAQIAAEIGGADSTIRGRFLANDGRSMMVITQASARANTRDVNADIERMKARFAALPYREEIRITGLPVLLATEFPVLIDQLRTGLLLAIFLAVGVVAFAARSFTLAAATLVPNLLPLLFAEAIIWATGSDLDITNIIALTIAFGIAIDNAVHVINSFNTQLRHYKEPEPALKQALVEISPALLASSVIVCVAAIVTQFSAMPSINVLGRLMILTLIMALITNLVILPSFILVLKRIGNARMFGGKAK